MNDKRIEELTAIAGSVLKGQIKPIMADRELWASVEPSLSPHDIEFITEGLIVVTYVREKRWN